MTNTMIWWSSSITPYLVPLEKPEIKARQSKVEDKIKEEFQIEFIDRQENPDPAVMKKLKRMENTVKYDSIELNRCWCQMFNFEGVNGLQ